MRKGKSLKHLLDVELTTEDMIWDRAMEISASVYERMNQLGLKRQELAERMDVSPAQVTKIMAGKQNMTLKTITKLEKALDFDLTYGFREPKKGFGEDYKALIRGFDSSAASFEKHQKANVGDFAVGVSK